MLIEINQPNIGTMNYVIKDHQGSMYATVTGNTVERYSFDAWGRRRNPQTLSYDNVTTSFDRGFTGHEHYDDFGLINMNGRLYDPLVGRMLSPDIVIQDEQNSQAYNRYSYCFNNPLRFTDPSGYVVNDTTTNEKRPLIIIKDVITDNDSPFYNSVQYNTDESPGSNQSSFANIYIIKKSNWIKIIVKTKTSTYTCWTLNYYIYGSCERGRTITPSRVYNK